MDIKAFWDAILRQDADVIRKCFHPNAWVNWHNTNEHYSENRSRKQLYFLKYVVQ